MFIAIIFIIIWPFIYIFLKKLSKRRKSLANKVVLITGSGNGLGRALCLAFAREKSHIICVDIDETANNETVRQIREISKDIRILNYAMDITNLTNIQQLTKNVFMALEQGVDILINNAAIIRYDHILNQDLSFITKTINVNLTSHFSTIHAFLPKMLEKNCGHIVGISSMAGHIPIEGCVPYCVTKTGTIALMEGLSLELRLFRSNVKTLTVYPGIMGTRLIPKNVRTPGIHWYKMIPFLVLGVNDVAKGIINAIKEEKRFHYTNWDYHVIFYLRRLLPIFITDWIEENLFTGLTYITKLNE